MQTIAWYTSLALMLLLTIVFLRVLSTSGRAAARADNVPTNAYRYRGKLFWLIIAAGVVISFVTLLPWPHGLEASPRVDKVVNVTARQWSWELSDNVARVGDRIEFRVQSRDVNHGFALYDPSMKIVAQIQAMPGYTNTLQHSFEKPGEYQILCMEYCGLAHHGMTARFTVLPSAQQQ